MNISTIRRVRLAGLAGCILLGCVLGGSVRTARAQSPVKISGLAYVDYYYQITDPDDAKEGTNGFTYRRLYLTADAPISDSFSARARLEATDGNLGPKGPTPFVKDLYLKWKVGGGHALTMGVTSPPSFAISEDVWGFRSLEKTILDLNGVVSSRDFGVRVNGPLGTDAVRYGLMVGNNETVFPEDDKYKRVYGQLEFYPAEGVTLALASNWAAYDGPREHQLVASALAGYVSATWRVGVEGFYELGTFERVDDAMSYGGSLFGAAMFAEQWGLVGRVDRVQRERLVEPDNAPARLGTARTTFGLVALVYQPHPQVQVMPNVRLLKDDDVGTANTLGRMTLFFTF